MNTQDSTDRTPAASESAAMQAHPDVRCGVCRRAKPATPYKESVLVFEGEETKLLPPGWLDVQTYICEDCADTADGWGFIEAFEKAGVMSNSHDNATQAQREQPWVEEMLIQAKWRGGVEGYAIREAVAHILYRIRTKNDAAYMELAGERPTAALSSAALDVLTRGRMRRDERIAALEKALQDILVEGAVQHRHHYRINEPTDLCAVCRAHKAMELSGAPAFEASAQRDAREVIAEIVSRRTMVSPEGELHPECPDCRGVCQPVRE